VRHPLTTARANKLARNLLAINRQGAQGPMTSSKNLQICPLSDITHKNTKIQNFPTLFSSQTARLFEYLEALNSSLAQSSGELWDVP